MCERYRPYRRLCICSSLQGFLGWRKAKFPNRYLDVEENNLLPMCPRNVLSESEHTHAHEDVQITRSEIKNRLVQKVKQDPSLPIKRIYYYVVREHGQGEGDISKFAKFVGIVRYFFQ
jgi:hypothetical protein